MQESNFMRVRTPIERRLGKMDPWQYQYEIVAVFGGSRDGTNLWHGDTEHDRRYCRAKSVVQGAAVEIYQLQMKREDESMEHNAFLNTAQGGSPEIELNRLGTG
jgi:hypothetical protein